MLELKIMSESDKLNSYYWSQIITCCPIKNDTLKIYILFDVHFISMIGLFYLVL